MIVGSICL